MHAFDILGDPVRRRIVELLGEARASGRAAEAAGALATRVGAEFGISQPAVSRHLKVLRDAGFVSCRVDGQRRLYAVADEPLREIDRWLDRYRAFWTNRFDALQTEVARGKRARRPRSSP